MASITQHSGELNVGPGAYLAIVKTDFHSSFFLSSPSFAFDPLREISHVWKFISPNILA